MALEFQRSTIAAVRAALPEHHVLEKPRTPAWLNRPGSTDCGEAWGLVRAIYGQLAAADLPDVIPPHGNGAASMQSFSAPTGTAAFSRSTKHSISMNSVRLPFSPTRLPHGPLSIDRSGSIVRGPRRGSREAVSGRRSLRSFLASTAVIGSGRSAMRSLICFRPTIAGSRRCASTTAKHRAGSTRWTPRGGCESCSPRSCLGN